MTFKAKCRQAGFTERQIETVRRYRTNHIELTDEEIITRYRNKGFLRNKRIGIQQEARQAGFSEREIETIRRFARNHKELTNEEVLTIYKTKTGKKVSIGKTHHNNTRDTKALKKKCRELQFSDKLTDKVCKFAKKNPKLTDEQILDTYIKYGELAYKRIGLTNKCRQRNLTDKQIEGIRGFAKRNKSLTDEQVIEGYLSKNHITQTGFAQKCRKVGITDNKASTARKYRKKHPELTDNEVIIHYRPDLRLNIFGNIILSNGEVLE